MTFLLDANVLIALCDELHAHHARANRWFEKEGNKFWATCPLTQNAFLRITSRLSYPRSTGSVAEQMRILQSLCALPGHHFWADDLSLLQSELWLHPQYAKSDELTDLYLLALAAKNRGKLVSLDRSIQAQRIRNGTSALYVISE